jgi:hypothetical protein
MTSRISSLRTLPLAWYWPAPAYLSSGAARVLFLLAITRAFLAGAFTTDAGTTSHIAAQAGADWVRLLRAMAVLKVVFAAGATAAVLWRRGVGAVVGRLRRCVRRGVGGSGADLGLGAYRPGGVAVARRIGRDGRAAVARSRARRSAGRAGRQAARDLGRGGSPAAPDRGRSGPSGAKLTPGCSRPPAWHGRASDADPDLCGDPSVAPDPGAS